MADIFPTEEELALLVTDAPRVQWWVLQADGSPPTDLLRPRPTDAQPTDVGGMTPWYNNRPHLHDEDHDWPWSIHARGTVESVRALQVAMLRRLKQPVYAARGDILQIEWTLIFGRHPEAGTLVALDLLGGPGAEVLWNTFLAKGVTYEFTKNAFRCWPYDCKDMQLQCALPESYTPPSQVVVQWGGDALRLSEGGNELFQGHTFLVRGVSHHVEHGEA